MVGHFPIGSSVHSCTRGLVFILMEDTLAQSAGLEVSVLALCSKHEFDHNRCQYNDETDRYGD